jgi:hypothetical protein
VRTRLLLTITALSMVVVAGCTTTSEGTPLPDSNATTESSPDEPPASGEDLPSDGAPKVENPLDVSRFEQKPCDALTPKQAQDLNVSATGEPDTDAFGEICRWRNDQTQGSVSMGFFSSDKRGLSSVYREAKGSDFPFFKPIEDIEGHPAVAFHTKVKEPTTDCAVAVGVTDQLVFTARVALSIANTGQKEPCEVAAQVAGMMMKTMQEAA